MYPWQAAALECGEEYNNLVYCAPTSGGKSLVAEVLMVRCLLRSQQDILQPRRSKPVSGGGAGVGDAACWMVEAADAASWWWCLLLLLLLLLPHDGNPHSSYNLSRSTGGCWWCCPTCPL